MARIEAQAFRDHIIGSGTVMDPEGTHHVFNSDMHGQKLDFDKILIGDPLYEEWMDISAQTIADRLPRLPEIIIGVANGTNRAAIDTARRFNGEVLGLESRKSKADPNKLFLPPLTRRVIGLLKPRLVVVTEDVGTTGRSSLQIAEQSMDAGAEDAIVMSAWKRQPELRKLDEAGVEHFAIIDEPLPTYDQDVCETIAEGFCARGWKLIPKGQ